MKLRLKKNKAFNLIELMTTLVIIGVLAAAAAPTYRMYVTKVSLAEAVTVLGAIDQNQRKYFTENNAFISTPPNPASTPGMDHAGNAGHFAVSEEWRSVGFPVVPGSQVLFSYQSFAGQTPPGSTTPVENATLHSPNDEMDLVRSGIYNSGLESAPMKSYALHSRDFHFDFGFQFSATAASGYDACIDACRGDVRCEAECVPDEEEVPSDEMCFGEFPLDPDCKCDENGQNCGTDRVGGAVNLNPGCGCVGMTTIDARTGACECVGGDDENSEHEDADEEDDDGVGGEGEGEGDGGDDNEDPEDGESIGEDVCDSFGVSRPVHFGIQEGLENYNWVVNTSVTNRTQGEDCWLIVRIIQVINGNISSSAPIQINPGG